MIKTLINRSELIPIVNPLESLEFNIFKEMDRMFDAFFPDLTYNEVPDVFKGYPVSNVLINQLGEVKIEIAVTGFKKEDIDIYLEDNCLMVSAEKTSEKKENKNEEWKTVYHNLKTNGFSKRYRLSNRMDIENAKISLENGILTILIPIKESSKPKQLKIE